MQKQRLNNNKNIPSNGKSKIKSQSPNEKIDKKTKKNKFNKNVIKDYESNSENEEYEEEEDENNIDGNNNKKNNITKKRIKNRNKKTKINNRKENNSNSEKDEEIEEEEEYIDEKGFNKNRKSMANYNRRNKIDTSARMSGMREMNHLYY